MSLDILFVEDNPHKRLRTIEFITTMHPGVQVTEAWSFTSGCQALESRVFSLVLLDISLPTYDKVGSEAGGRFRTLGGREIARKIIRSGLLTKIMFITQYASFSDRGASYTFAELRDELAKECGDQFSGMVLYDSTQSAWKESISKALGSMIK